MGITTFHEITFSESTARKYLLGYCWKNHQRFCPRCRERKLYHVSNNKRRCARCSYTFHDFSQRFLSGCWKNARQWLFFLKLFELDVDAKSIAAQLQCSYATVLKAQDITRRAILAQALDANAFYEQDVWPGPRRPKPQDKIKDAPVFGVISLKNYVVCDVLPDITPENIIHFKLNFHLKTACVGRVVYTAPYREYQTLVACGPSMWPAKYITHEDKGIPADANGFWPYAKSRLKKLRGVLPAQFPLYLKEWELRYNHQSKDLFPVLANAICTLVPDPGGFFSASPHNQDESKLEAMV